MKNKAVNQLHRATTGKPIDNTWKVYFKKSGCTMLLFKNLTYHSAYGRVNALKKTYGDWCGTFIITK